MEEEHKLMTDADFERALDCLYTEDHEEVSDLLKVMNESRIISWEDAEKIMCELSTEPIKSSLPQQTRPSEPDNNTDVDQSIRRLIQNDPKLVEINLNNMKRTPIPQIKRILEAIRENTFLEKISLANMGLYDMDIAPLVEVLEDNESLRSINVETNYLSGEFFARLMRAALKNQTLEEIKGVNQGTAFSTTAEREIIDAVFKNHNLIKVSINLRLPEGRHKIEQATIRNQEIRRIIRRQAAAEARAKAEKATETAKKIEVLPETKSTASTSNEASSKEPFNRAVKPAFNVSTTEPLEKQCNAEKQKPPALIVFKKRREKILNETREEKEEENKSQPPVTPKYETPKIPKKLPPSIDILKTKNLPRSQRNSIGQISLFDFNTSFENDDNNTAKVSNLPRSKPGKLVGKTILPSLTPTSVETKTAAFIPEAPLGKASAMAKKFTKAEAAAREAAIQSSLRRPSGDIVDLNKKIIEINGSVILPDVAGSFQICKNLDEKEKFSKINENNKTIVANQKPEIIKKKRLKNSEKTLETIKSKISSCELDVSKTLNELNDIKKLELTKDLKVEVKPIKLLAEEKTSKSLPKNSLMLKKKIFNEKNTIDVNNGKETTKITLKEAGKRLSVSNSTTLNTAKLPVEAKEGVQKNLKKQHSTTETKPLNSTSTKNKLNCIDSATNATNSNGVEKINVVKKSPPKPPPKPKTKLIRPTYNNETETEKIPTEEVPFLSVTERLEMLRLKRLAS